MHKLPKCPFKPEKTFSGYYNFSSSGLDRRAVDKQEKMMTSAMEHMDRMGRICRYFLRVRECNILNSRIRVFW